MKKLLAAILCTGMALSISGCTPGNILEEFTSTGDTSAENTSEKEAPKEIKPRVYIDELSGKLQDFNGNQLKVSAEDELYIFDVSQATLECADGMITGDLISVIYEGQLSDTDTSSVKALKVVDEFHKKNKLKERTAHGEILGLTPNTITIRAKSGKTATYPITGTEQYYQNGLKAGNWVYLRFKGKFPEDGTDNPTVLNASHLKVLNISDTENINAPAPTPSPVPGLDGDTENIEKSFMAAVQSINLNILQVIPAGKTEVLSLDLAETPSYFKGGIAPGSRVSVHYKGELKENSLEGISVQSVTGEDPDLTDNRHISFTVSGTVVGTTANTVTIQTTDGAINTFRIDSAQNNSTGGLAQGCSLCITFHPSESKTSNIYTAVKIEDAA